MLSLAPNDTIRGVAGAATAITYLVTGALTPNPKVRQFRQLAQGQLPASAGVIFTAPAAESAFIHEIILVNPTATPEAVTLYQSGAGAGNVFGSFTLGAGCTATYNKAGWRVLDVNGRLT